MIQVIRAPSKESFFLVSYNFVSFECSLVAAAQLNDSFVYSSVKDPNLTRLERKRQAEEQLADMEREMRIAEEQLTRRREELTASIGSSRL